MEVQICYVLKNKDGNILGVFKDKNTIQVGKDSDLEIVSTIYHEEKRKKQREDVPKPSPLIYNPQENYDGPLSM